MREGGRVLDVLDGDGVRRWCRGALSRLREAADELNRLNVYPVKDSDTGVNLVTTVSALCAGLPDGGGLPAVLPAMSRAALMGAHGNSGTILSQLLRGVAEAGRSVPSLGAAELAAGLRRGADLAYEGVPAPVEGTILSVARAAAEAAEATAGSGGDLAAVARAAAGAARAALARTPEQLPVLAEAGVVDAGGLGWCVVLDALVEIVCGTPAPPRLPAGRDGEPVAARETGSEGFAYEVQYLLDAEAAAVDALKQRLAALGDSLVVVGDGATWNVHVHVNDVGAAVEAGVEAGRPHRISVTRFADQFADQGAAPSPRADAGSPAPPPAGRARVVALVDGPGLAALAAAAGARTVEVDPAGGSPGHEALAGRLLAAVRATGSAQVVLLPNRRDAAAAVAAVVERARADDRTVAVVPSRSAVQGIAALAVHDPSRAFADDLVGMASAAAATRTVEVEVEAEADEGAGERVRGRLDGAVVARGDDALAVAAEVIERALTGGGDLVTVVTGASAGDLGDRLRARLRESRPDVEVQCHHGGQRRPLLIAGVE
ncbi:MAG: DAK2 domain-containing protein [Frankiaceae bacterium]